MNDQYVRGEVRPDGLPSEISYRLSAYSRHHHKKQLKNAFSKPSRRQKNQQDQAWLPSASIPLLYGNGSLFLRELFETCSGRLRQRFGSASTRSRRLPEAHPKNSRRNVEESYTQMQLIPEKPAKLGGRFPEDLSTKSSKNIPHSKSTLMLFTFPCCT
ncbi:hypothetical protein [Olivibacter sp. XZL3]|uniref:hypothetical protein n=1 Tax=Olivibacter sp. XZL3 TaxID=1735116 RepID=UPI001065325D|nr:hypothetical protein [Olivibacter sp. XZL3]